jgi:DNA-directed RNA polymerase subunit RPC12/RpoP
LLFQGTPAQTNSLSDATPNILVPPVSADLFRVRSDSHGVKDKCEHSEDSSMSFSNEDSDPQACREHQSTEHYLGPLAEALLEHSASLRARETLFYSNNKGDKEAFSTIVESESKVSCDAPGYKCCKGSHPCIVFHPEGKLKTQALEYMETEAYVNENILLVAQTPASDIKYNGNVTECHQTTHIPSPDNKIDDHSTLAVLLNAKRSINKCTNSTNTNYTCHKCRNTYAMDINLSFHICNLMNSKCYVCNICGKEFINIKTMRCHSAYHNGKYQCETCGNYFSAEIHRNVHMRKHTGEKPHICNLCGKTFMYSNSLTYHLNIHRGENSFICDICGHRSFSKGNFERHKASHTKIKPHMCEICGKAFTVNVDLKRHRLTHSNDKNFICDICDKRFKTAAILSNHQRLHSGERPYSCDLCGKRFARNDGLKEHRLTHTGEKRHSCTRCGKQFTWSKGLRKHKCDPVSNI